MKSEREIREDICEIGHRMYLKDLVVGTDGNISVRLPGDTILLTPSGMSKGDLSPESLIKTDMEGQKISGTGNASSEIRMHIMVYKERPDVRAVIHAHPPYALAFTVAGMSLSQCVLPEVVLTIGNILTTEYATPTTEKVAEVIRDLLKESDALLLDRHGSLTIGRDLWEAYHKLERLEHAAKITLFARQLGRVKVLQESEVRDIVNLRSKFGLPDIPVKCNNCGACGKPTDKEIQGKK